MRSVYTGDMAVDPEGARFRLGEARGHHETWSVRGKHPTRPLAFTIRYTIVSPANRPQDASAELFAISYDGERSSHVIAREKHPLAEAILPTSGLGVQIGSARIQHDHASGSARRRLAPSSDGVVALGWELAFRGGGDPLLLLPERFYEAKFPRSKTVAIRPGLSLSGELRIGSERIDVAGWRGSLNHSWGVRHTDRYAWGQVIGFDEAHDTIFQLATARVALGPLLSPKMTPMVLRHRGREHRLNALRKVFGRARLRGLRWAFKARGPNLKLRGIIHASPLDVVTMRFDDPAGGDKLCVATRLASCELEVTTAEGVEHLRTGSGADFELMVDRLESIGLDNLPPPI